MRKYVLCAALAALMAGCGQDEQSALSELPPMPAAAASAAAPAPAATSAAPAIASASSSARQGIEKKHAFDAGVTIVMARDLCKLPIGDVQKLGVYGQWLVADDEELKKAYVAGAYKTAEVFKEVAGKDGLAQWRAKVCPGIQASVATLSRAITSTAVPGQAPAVR